MKPVEEDTPKPDKQATPEHAESRKLTIAEDTKEDTSAKKYKSDSIKEETKKSEPMEKDRR